MTENAGMCRKVWLHLLRHGGRWSGQDIAAEILTDGNTMHDALRTMVGSEYLRRYDKTATKPRITYGVTADCRVPRWVTVQDILACDLVPLVAEVAQC